MKFVPTTAVRKLAAFSHEGHRIHGVAGGTSASKTISIEQILIHKAQRDLEPTMTSITSESVPHLKRGAMRDFKNIMEATGYWEDERWNATDFTYTFPLMDQYGKMKAWAGSKIEFFSLDMPHKVRGPRRHRLFINEANNIPKETYDQLEVRTSDEVWLDWNPTNEFWFYTDLLNQPDVGFIILTYQDNEGLSSDIVRSIESRKANKNWWLVYGLGQLGEVEGKIYKGWKLDLEDVPFEARLERYGLDFGYSQDPAAIVAVYYYNGSYIIDEILYAREQSNRRLADVLKNLPPAMVCADSAEPKSIDELLSYGISAFPAQKGPGSLHQGISYVQDQKIMVTKRSLNLIKEYRNYLWKTDKDGRILDVPEGGNDHALDAARYALETLKPAQPKYYQHVKQMNFTV